ncbi:MAG: SEC-C domain-containing protein, partial [Lachnospiraceae bacterium]|nr:SEC-C domain-containing protein [Lachnospiraceae bacterium]
KDLDDAVYKTKREKYNAVVREVREAYEKGQPVLVGTISIEVSELLSSLFKKNGIPHNVLNAKFHEMEAEIIAHAGEYKAVTIATNMAGRGTDIKLDPEAKAAGGLKVIGTERHEARRIDNQLRGRSGRQGDPGESRFYLSLEDDLMRLFGGDNIMSVFNRLGVEEGQQIEHKMLSGAIERAQKRIESNNYAIRENLLKYDEVINEQREIIYKERRQVLDGESMRDVVMKMVTDICDGSVDRCISEDQDPDLWDLQELNRTLLPNVPVAPITESDISEKGFNKKKLEHLIRERATKLYEAKEAEFPTAEAMRELERVVLLRAIDRRWMDHIDDMDQLRQGIGLAAYGNRDPLTEYKVAGYDMFNSMMAGIREDTVRSVYFARVERPEEREQVAKITGTNKDDTLVKAPKKRAQAKVYPNDPCPCGSGLKYKNCHGKK